MHPATRHLLDVVKRLGSRERGFQRLTLESLRTALATADAKGAITFANDAFAACTGRDRAGPETNLDRIVFVEDDRKRIQQNIVRVGEGKAAASLIDARLDFKQRWCRCPSSPHSAPARVEEDVRCCCATSGSSAKPGKR